MTTPNRLSMTAALSEALRLWPAMLGGAGGALALAAMLAALPRSDALEGASFPLGLAWGLASLVALSAVTRIGLVGDFAASRRSGMGPQGFQIGRVEARLAGAILLLALFFAIVMSMLGLTALALFGAAGLDVEALKARDWANVGPAWKLSLLAFVGLGLIAAPIALAVRVCLFAQATIARGRMTSLGATVLTNGAMIPLFVGLSLIATPGLLWLLAAVTMSMEPMWGFLGWIAIMAFVQTPLTAGFLGAAYRRLDQSSDDLAPL